MQLIYTKLNLVCRLNLENVSNKYRRAMRVLGTAILSFFENASFIKHTTKYKTINSQTLISLSTIGITFLEKLTRRNTEGI